MGATFAPSLPRRHGEAAGRRGVSFRRRDSFPGGEYRPPVENDPANPASHVEHPRESQHASDDSGEGDLHAEPRWSAEVGVLTAWLLPVRTARRTAHVPLRQAFVVHVLAACLVVLVTIAVPAWLQLRGVENLSGLSAEWVWFVRELVEGFSRHPLEATAIAAGIAVCIEGVFLVLALLLMPWGAYDEPLRESYACALRRIWLHTAHLLVIALLVSGLVLTLDRLDATWTKLHTSPKRPGPPPWLALSPDDPGYAEAVQDFEAALQSWREEMDLYESTRPTGWQSRPWAVRYQEPIFVNFNLMLFLWWLFGMLAGVGAARRVKPIARSPTCEFCGYNLTGMPIDGRCPECGIPVAASLGPNARPGAIWQHRRDVGRWHALLHCWHDAIHRPTWFGRQLMLSHPGSDHRTFLYLHLPIFFAIGAAGILLLCVVVVGAWGSLVRDPGTMVTAAVVYGAFAMVAGLGFTLLAALLAGSYYGLREERNLLTASMQVSAYLSGYVTLWMLFAALAGPALILLARSGRLRGLFDLTPTTEDQIAFLLWVLPNVALAIAYGVLVARGTAAMRYANR